MINFVGDTTKRSSGSFFLVVKRHTAYKSSSKPSTMKLLLVQFFLYFASFWVTRAGASDWTPLGDDFRLSRRFYLSRDGSRVGRYYFQQFNNTERSTTLEVYEWTGAVWNLVGEPIEFGDVSFNFRISGDGNRIVCGTRGEFVCVYGYSAQDNQWQQVGQDILPSQDVLDLEFRSFPSSLAVSHTGDRFAFSFAPEIRLQGSAITFDQMFGIGRVWIYELDSTSGTWEVVGDGEPLRDENSPWFGANLESTYVFLTQAKQAAFVWAPPAILSHSYLLILICYTVSGDGSRLAIGQGKAIQNSEGRNQISLTWRVYESGPTPSSPWLSIGAESLDSYGILDAASLSFDGSMVAFGTRCAAFDLILLDICVGDVGKARVLQYNDGTWTQLGQELVGTAGGDGFGEVSLSGDGTRLAVGADGDALEYPPDDFDVVGSVSTFEFDPRTLVWVQDGELLEAEGEESFGERVSLSLDGSRLGVEFGDGARVYVRSLSLVPTVVSTTEPPTNQPTSAAALVVLHCFATLVATALIASN